MLVLKTRKELKSVLSSLDRSKPLGLVPTMGALHHGHLALVKKALSENDRVVVSIFVNPTQFNNAEDLHKYPKNLPGDVALLSGISSDIIVFAPSVTEIYADNVDANEYNFEGLDKVMEGTYRQGHFNGVGTIVEALLKLVGPDRAYFGEKDFQQLQIIKKLVAKQNLPVKIIGCPIVRESNGLALSSRNKRLSPSAQKEAPFIYKTLKTAKKRFATQSAQKVRKWAEAQFNGHPFLNLEYITIADVETLMPVKRKQKHKKYRIFAAVYAENVRLIDNIALN